MSPFPTDLELSTQLISDQLVDDAQALAALQKLAERGYEVHTGLTDKLADAIHEMAQEPAIKEYCPNDSGSRFKDRLATEKWLQKGRAAFVLLKHDFTDDDLHLVGYGWSGPGTTPHVPGGETTFAIRVGEAGHGQGLAEPFSRLIIAATEVLYDSKNMWLETWQSNGAAVHIYQKMGFKIVHEKPDQRPTQKGGTVADTRLYMTK